MKRLDPTSILPALCLAASTAVLVWGIASGAEVAIGFRLGLSLALMLTFGLVWVFGIRYPDVGWMVIIAALLALQTLAVPAPLGHGAAWLPAVAGTVQLALRLALAAFLLAFFRAPRRPGRQEVGFVIAVSACFVLLVALPEPTLLSLGLHGRLQLYVGAVLLGYAVIQGFMTLPPLPPKRQRYVAMVVAACVVTFGLDLLIAQHADPAGVVPTAGVDFGFVGILAGSLLADLVIYHRNFVREKATRGAGPSDTARVARQELGDAIRALLPVPAGQGRFGDFAREFVVRRSPTFAGDWHYVWETGDEQRLLFGEIRGAGPAAPLGIATVVAFLGEAQTRGLSLDAALRYLNDRLLDVFERQLATTVQAVSLGADGSVELCNSGGAGFFTVSREGGRYLPLSSTPLGVSAAVEITYSAVALEDLDVLFAATDGIVDGAGGARRLLDFYDREMDLSLELTAIRDQVLQLGGSQAGDDGGILLVIQRQNAESSGSATTRRA